MVPQGKPWDHKSNFWQIGRTIPSGFPASDRRSEWGSHAQGTGSFMSRWNLTGYFREARALKQEAGMPPWVMGASSFKPRRQSPVVADTLTHIREALPAVAGTRSRQARNSLCRLTLWMPSVSWKFWDEVDFVLLHFVALHATLLKGMGIFHFLFPWAGHTHCFPNRSCWQWQSDHRLLGLPPQPRTRCDKAWGWSQVMPPKHGCLPTSLWKGVGQMKGLVQHLVALSLCPVTFISTSPPPPCPARGGKTITMSSQLPPPHHLQLLCRQI